MITITVTIRKVTELVEPGQSSGLSESRHVSHQELQSLKDWRVPSQ